MYCLKRDAYIILAGNPEGDYLQDLDADSKIILKLFFTK